MQFRSAFLLLTLSLCLSQAHAQFIGMESFENDTLLRAQLKKNRVKYVVETIKEDSSMARFNGRYNFDANGMVTDQIVPNGDSFGRRKYKYDKNGRTIRGEAYNDTVNISNWKNWTRDAKGRIVKEVYGFAKDGESVERITLEYATIAEEPGKKRLVSDHYSAGKLEFIKEEFDSIAGKDTFYVTLKFREGDRSKGAHEKSLLFFLRKPNKIIKMELFYGMSDKVYGISTTSYEFDNKDRLIKMEITDHNHLRKGNYYLPDHVRAAFAGELEGKKTIAVQNFFDAKGELEKFTDSEFHNDLAYNTKGQLIGWKMKRYAQAVGWGANMSPGFDEATQVHSYNERGMIKKVVVTYTDKKGSRKKNELTYRYAYR